MGDPAKSDGIAGKFGAWIAVYAIYLILADWTYLDSYFAVFGINAKSLEFGLDDVLARAFTVLIDAGFLLSIVYLAVFGVSVIVEAFKKDSGISYVITAILIVAGFVPTYYIAKSAGRDRANTDRGDRTKLAHLSFIEKGCSYHGKLVYLKGDTLYVYNLRPFPDNRAPGPNCPIALPDKEHQSTIPQIWIIRNSELEDVRIDQYAKEAQ